MINTQSLLTMSRGGFVSAPKPTAGLRPATVEEWQIRAWFSTGNTPKPPVRSLRARYTSSLSLAEPPISAIRVTWLTVASPDFSTKDASRVCFINWAMRSTAHSSDTSSQWSEWRARCLTVVGRCGFDTSSSVFDPFGHSRPSFTGLRGSPSIATISPSLLKLSCEHPTAQ